jgi:hypothetical protein
MELVIQAALAPSDPSAQDRSVAAAAQQIKSEAEIEKRQHDDAEDTDPDNSSPITQEATNTALAAYNAAANVQSIISNASGLVI